MGAITVIIVTALVGGGFCFGVLYGQSTCQPEIVEVKTLEVRMPPYYYVRMYPSPMTIEQGIEYPKEARYSHQRLIDRDEPLPGELGGLAEQRKWVERYNQIIGLLEEVTGGDTAGLPRDGSK